MSKDSAGPQTKLDYILIKRPAHGTASVIREQRPGKLGAGEALLVISGYEDEGPIELRACTIAEALSYDRHHVVFWVSSIDFDRLKDQASNMNDDCLSRGGSKTGK